MKGSCLYSSLLIWGVLGGCHRDNPALAATDYSAAKMAFSSRPLPFPNPQPDRPVMMVPGAERITYQSTGLSLSAFVSPVSAGKHDRPAVLFLHGGFAFGQDDWEQVQPFREAGFVVMTPILRSENGQPGQFSLFYNEVEDVLSAAEALKNRPDVDPSRIFVAGHSVGGTLTMLAALASPIFHGAASFSGSPDQKSWIRLSQTFPPILSDDECAIRSPQTFPASLKCSIRMFFGSQEDFFRQSNSDFAKAIKSKGGNAEAIEVRGDHSSAVPEEMRLAIEFFNSL